MEAYHGTKKRIWIKGRFHTYIVRRLINEKNIKKFQKPFFCRCCMAKMTAFGIFILIFSFLCELDQVGFAYPPLLPDTESGKLAGVDQPEGGVLSDAKNELDVGQCQNVPDVFKHKNASFYLGFIKMLSVYLGIRFFGERQEKLDTCGSFRVFRNSGYILFLCIRRVRMRQFRHGMRHNGILGDAGMAMTQDLEDMIDKAGGARREDKGKGQERKAENKNGRNGKWDLIKKALRQRMKNWNG